MLTAWSAVADRLAIEDLIVSYATALDTSDWDLCRSCFLPDAHIGMDKVGQFDSVEALIARLAVRLTIFGALQHFVSNYVIRGDGDTAAARCHFVSHHVPRDGAPYTYGGSFSFTVVRTRGGWRFSSHAVRILWEAGSPQPVD